MAFKFQLGVVPLLLVAAIVPLADACCLAQSVSPSQPTANEAPLPVFEVISIKPRKSTDEGFWINPTPSGISFSGVPVRFLIQQAFDLGFDRIIDGPEWISTDRFDIEAKVDASEASRLDSLSFPEREKMLLPLLVERFGLKYHHETRELPVYALLIAKSGSKMKEFNPADRSSKYDPSVDCQLSAESGHIGGRNCPLLYLTKILSLQLKRTILDKSGLTGAYGFDLKWAPDTAPNFVTPGTEALSAGAPLAGPEDPPLFTAIQEQLGLKLEAVKAPIDVVVIDYIEKPSPN